MYLVYWLAIGKNRRPYALKIAIVLKNFKAVWSVYYGIKRRSYGQYIRKPQCDRQYGFRSRLETVSNICIVVLISIGTEVYSNKLTKYGVTSQNNSFTTNTKNLVLN